MSNIFVEFSPFVSIYAFFGCTVKRGMLAVRVRKSVEFWILFYRNKPCWSLALYNNINSYCQSIMAVYITDVKAAKLVNKNKKLNPFFM